MLAARVNRARFTEDAIAADEGHRSSLADLLARQNVILLDQRGTGPSGPNLACPGDVVPGLVPPGGGQGVATAAAPPVGTPTPIALPPWGEIAQSTIQCML